MLCFVWLILNCIYIVPSLPKSFFLLKCMYAQEFVLEVMLSRGEKMAEWNHL